LSHAFIFFRVQKREYKPKFRIGAEFALWADESGALSGLTLTSRYFHRDRQPVGQIKL